MVELGKLKLFLKNKQFPLMAGVLVDAAKTERADPDVVAFLEAIDPSEELQSKEDVVLRADETNLLQEEKAHVPFYEAIELEED